MFSWCANYSSLCSSNPYVRGQCTKTCGYCDGGKYLNRDIAELLCSSLHVSNDLGISQKTYFDGYCRYGDAKSHWIKVATAINLVSCYETCQKTDDCVAFSYSIDSKDNCNLYKGGPYTYGSDHPISKCYIMPLGNFSMSEVFINNNTVQYSILSTRNIQNYLP